MPLIDGIGDEVVHFATIVMVIAVAALAWWSTNARPDRYRTVLLMRSHHPVTMSIRPGVPPPTMVYTNRQPHTTGQPTTDTVTMSSANNATESSPPASSESVPMQEMDSIVDADMALLDNNRLHFFRRLISPRGAAVNTEPTSEVSDTQAETEPASNAQIREMDSIVSAMEADVTTNCGVFHRAHSTRNIVANASNSAIIAKFEKQEKEKKEAREAAARAAAAQEEANGDRNPEGDHLPTENTDNTVQAGDRKILIRLKYLNDTLKEVEGSLDELLKDFKWRHFSTELSSEFLVRLIFNGRVLCDEAATLRALGLHHRAVVHCLVHPPRAPTQRGGAEGAGAGEAAAAAAAAAAEGARAATERAWHLEGILMTLVSVTITVIWFFRCEYSNMFTASASVALFGLTVFYSVAIFGLYLSDTFQFDRRQPQPVPNN